MKKQISIILIVSLLLVACLSTSLADNGEKPIMEFKGEPIELSLEKAIEVTLSDNPTLKKADLDIDQAKIEYDKLRKAVRMGEKIYGNRKEDNLQYMKNIKLPDLSADFIVANAERNKLATVESLKAEIEKSYYSLLQAQEAAEISKENMELSKELYEKTKQKFELGLVAKQEVVNSELNYIKSQNQYNASINGVIGAKMALNSQLGYDVMADIQLTDKLMYKEMDSITIDEAITQALTNRNEIKAAEYAYEQAKLQMDIYELELPEIAYDYREQVIKLDKAEKDLATAKKNVEMEVRMNYLEVLQKQKEIASGEKAVELAELSFNLSKVSYDTGVGLMTDVQQAQIALQNAKLGLSKAILDYNLAVLKFEDSIGIGRTSLNSSISGAMSF